MHFHYTFSEVILFKVRWTSARRSPSVRRFTLRLSRAEQTAAVWRNRRRCRDRRVVSPWPTVRRWGQSFPPRGQCRLRQANSDTRREVRSRRKPAAFREPTVDAGALPICPADRETKREFRSARGRDGGRRRLLPPARAKPRL